MWASEIEGRLERLLEDAKLEVQVLDPRITWEIFKAILREPIEDPGVEDDTASFQCGRRGWEDGWTGPSAYFTRHFALWDEHKHEYVATELDGDPGLGFAFGFRYREELREAFGEVMHWSSEYKSVEDFVAAVEADPAFQAILAHTPEGSELDVDAPAP